MKKSLLYILASLGLCAGVVSCAPEEIINDTDTARHQVTDLKCAVDDEEATLTWSVPEGWEPTDYLITYNDAAAVAQRILTEGKNRYTITGLQNGFDYTFNARNFCPSLTSVKRPLFTSGYKACSIIYDILNCCPQTFL